MPSLAAISDRIRARDAEIRLALRTTIAALIAHLVAVLLGLSQGYWVVITAIIVMQASVGGSLKAAADRMAGTLVGAAYGAVIAVALPHEGGWLLSLAIVLAVAPMALLAALKSSFRVAPITALIVLVPLRSQVGSPLDYALERVLEIAIGNLVGVAVALSVLPARAHTLVTRAAATIADLNAELLTALIEGLESDAGRPGVPAIHARIRASLKALEAAADEAARERRGHVTGRADPEPLVRTLYRVRHDLVMVGRATARPLPESLSASLNPCLLALRDEAAGSLRSIAATLRARSKVGPSDRFDAALKSYVATMDRLRTEGVTRSLPSEDVGRIYALRFAFEQLGLDLRDLAARVGEHAEAREAEATAAA
jgi:uncharacterized membrane protein YccC